MWKNQITVRTKGDWRPNMNRGMFSKETFNNMNCA